MFSDPKGTGDLFFKFVEIKEWLEKHNEPYQTKLFWLYENVASMPEWCRNTMSEYDERTFYINKYKRKILNNNKFVNLRKLGQKPTYLDSALFTCMHRPRLYWGNTLWGPFEPCKVSVNDVIDTKIRKSKVIKVRTVTTQKNSLLQG